MVWAKTLTTCFLELFFEASLIELHHHAQFTILLTSTIKLAHATEMRRFPLDFEFSLKITFVVVRQNFHCNLFATSPSVKKTAISGKISQHHAPKGSLAQDVVVGGGKLEI
jgi:hypothetical protein